MLLNMLIQKIYDIYNFDFTKSLISSKNHKIEDIEVVGNFIKFKLNNYVYSLYLDNFTRIENINKVDLEGDINYILLILSYSL